MSTPSSSTWPARLALGTSSCMRLRMRRKVDLPQPEGPIRAVTWPAGITRLTSSRTWWSPNQALIPSATRVAGCPAGTRGRVCVAEMSAEKSVVMACSQGVGEKSGEVLEDVPEAGQQNRGSADPDGGALEPEGGPGDQR